LAQLNPSTRQASEDWSTSFDPVFAAPGYARPVAASKTAAARTIFS
jgi:hypothetical protein